MNLQRSVVFDKSQLPKFFMKKLTRERVVPIISASVVWLIGVKIASGFPSFPKFAGSEACAPDAFRSN